MVGNSAATVRDDEFQCGEILKNVGGEELHESGGVAVQIVSARGVKIRIARSADVNHGGNFELSHFFVEWIPEAVGERRIAPMAARGIRIQIAADESELFHAAG